MNKDYKAKLLEKAGIYVDCCQLLKCVYKLLFSMPKKDRVIIGDKIIEYNLSMIAHFSKGFQFKECRLAEIDSFLFDFDRMKALLRMASELKILLPAKYVLLFEYIERIDEGVAKWRNASTATKSMTLNALCAMQFICCLKLTTQGTTHVQWAPLGNATVTWA